MADQVGTVNLPPLDNGDDTLRVETETRPEDAPWGYRPNGEPYKRDPARYQKRSAGQRRSSPPKAAPRKPKGSKHRDTVLGIAQIAAIPLAAAATRNEVFLADLVALNETAPGIADAFDQVAQTNPKLAAVLDKLAEVGPFGLILGALTPLIIQGACNHGLIPAGVMGAVDPADLIASLNGEPMEDAA